jgi:transcriptional regulator with XRE-family HTH domain
MTYGDTIKRLRTAAGITQSALAEKIGTLRNDELSRIEAGDRQLTEEEYLAARLAIIAIRAERDEAYEAALAEGCPA